MVEIFVGNVPHGSLAQDLVKFLLKLLPSDSTGASVLRCEVKRNRKSTFAFVRLRSGEVAEDLRHNCGTLVFGGRPLRIKPAKATFRRPMGTQPGFACGELQLCAEWPPGELTCLWAVNLDVKFQVNMLFVGTAGAVVSCTVTTITTAGCTWFSSFPAGRSSFFI